jgi:hypothetical protein
MTSKKQTPANTTPKAPRAEHPTESGATPESAPKAPTPEEQPAKSGSTLEPKAPKTPKAPKAGEHPPKPSAPEPKPNHQAEHHPTKSGSRSNPAPKAAPAEEHPPKSGTTPEPERDEVLQNLATLSQVLDGDLNAIDPDDALKLVNEWYGSIHDTKAPETKELASGLKELQKLLKHKDVKGHDLGELIGQIGEQTTDLATNAEKAIKTPLQHLGKQLAKVGRSLAKAEDLHQLEALDSLVDIIAGESNTSDFKAAIDEIDRWHDLLHTAEDESLKQIAIELKALKQILKGNKVKGAELSQKLIHLGEQTTSAAVNAQRGFKGVVQKLGKVLSAFGKSLA